MACRRCENGCDIFHTSMSNSRTSYSCTIINFFSYPDLKIYFNIHRCNHYAADCPEFCGCGKWVLGGGVNEKYQSMFNLCCSRMVVIRFWSHLALAGTREGNSRHSPSSLSLFSAWCQRYMFRYFFRFEECNQFLSTMPSGCGCETRNFVYSTRWPRCYIYTI